MANLTLSVDDDLLKRARFRALERGTSVNALVRDYLESFAGQGQERAVRALLELSDRLRAGSGPEGRSWSREQLYEERLSHVSR